MIRPVETNESLADEFAEKGTVLHFAIRCGFLPYDEAAAEKILRDIIKSEEQCRYELEKIRKSN